MRPGSRRLPGVLWPEPRPPTFFPAGLALPPVREEEAEALALLASAQRTLKDSRHKQAQSRLSRNFYPPGKGPQAKPYQFKPRAKDSTKG